MLKYHALCQEILTDFHVKEEPKKQTLKQNDAQTTFG